MSVIQYLPVDRIHRRPDARPTDPAAVAELRESIDQSEDKQPHQPVCVRPVGNGWELIFGNHRLEAVKELGVEEIFCIEVFVDDLEAERLMLDENVRRKELDAAERAKQMARLKAIYLLQHPETKPVAERGGPGRGKTTDNLSTVSSFADVTAEATGRDPRSVRRDVERGEKIEPAALDAIAGTSLSTGKYLDELKRTPRDEQVAKVQRDLSRPPKPAPKPKKPEPAPSKDRSETAADVQAARCAHEYGRLVEFATEIGDYTAEDIIAGCPPRQRASLCQHLSGLIDKFHDIMEGVSR